jgi:alpha-amylase/alpha-mannosidase (GH57 family)
MSADRLNVVICWHMHQPNYYEPGSGQYVLPWTDLHATKDYVDMVALLEENPQAKVVVNFAPILLEQISDYAAQLQAWTESNTPLKDPLLAALASAALPVTDMERLAIAHQCVRVNHEHLVKPFRDFERLMKMVKQIERDPEMFVYLDDQFVSDLLVWYHLAWLGETIHQNDVRVARLVKKGRCFTLHDRVELLEIITELISGVLGRYRVLAEREQIELCMNPYAHPIVPLLLDMGSARDAWPDVSLPVQGRYPDGETRANWHMLKGVEVFKQHFGRTPSGCWPSEGAISTDTLRLFSEHGIRWAASGESVLQNSMERAERKQEMHEQKALYRPYRVADYETACFFRDDKLSDLIGFTYADWFGDDAAANLVEHLENIANHCDEPADRVVSIILDGENAWEHYPHNGYYFLRALYQKLLESPLISLVTFSEALDAGVSTNQIDSLVAGSWVYGTFSTWVGDHDKNSGWNLLIEAKRAYDTVMASDRLDQKQREAAEKQLAVCEGSDWFWWFGDYNPSDTVSDFEHLYRSQIAWLYRLLGEEPPESLSHVMSHGSGVPEHGGAMRRGQG